MSGHTMDKCYKLHGFPSDNNNNFTKRRFAHLAQGGDIDNENDIVSGSFTKDQCSQILQMLNKHKILEESTAPSTNTPSSSAYFEGKKCLFSHSYSGCIIDSGALDHIFI